MRGVSGERGGREKERERERERENVHKAEKRKVTRRMGKKREIDRATHIVLTSLLSIAI